MATFCPLKAGPALSQDCIDCDERLCRKNVFYLLVAGTRTYTDYASFSNTMDHLLSKITADAIMIVSGGARGADAMAERYAKEHHFSLKIFPADWSRGARAGYERNRKMHEFISHFSHRGCALFWDGVSRGTEQSIALAKEFGTQLRIVRIPKAANQYR